MTKKNIIIIAKTTLEADMNFYHAVLTPDSNLSKKAIIIMFPSVEQFSDFLITMPNDYEFSLLIHIGMQGTNKKQALQYILSDLKKLPYYEKLKYEYTSREGDDNTLEREVRHTQKMGLEEFDVSMIPINKKSNLIDIDNITGPTKKYNVAILTALYEYEHEAFDFHIETEIPKSDINTKIGKFKETHSFPKDYKGEIILAWQREMGMVDASAFSSRIITRYNPRFLILGGVCGGLENEVKLFDVIIPKNIHDYMSGKFEKGEFIPRPLFANIDPDLIDYLLTKKREIIDNMMKIADPILHKIIEKGFQIHFKNYACGPWVVKTDGFLSRIADDKDIDIIGLEMESLGVIRASKLYSKNSQYGLVIKSVMDFTNQNKNDGYGGQIKSTAAMMSYLCIRALIPILMEYQDPKAI